MPNLTRRTASRAALGSGLSGTATPNVAPTPTPAGSLDLQQALDGGGSYRPTYEGQMNQDPIYGGDFYSSDTEGTSVQSPTQGPLLGGSSYGTIGGQRGEKGGFTAIRSMPYDLGASGYQPPDNMDFQHMAKDPAYSSILHSDTSGRIPQSFGQINLQDRSRFGMMGANPTGTLVDPRNRPGDQSIGPAIKSMPFAAPTPAPAGPVDTGVRPGVRPQVNAVEAARGTTNGQEYLNPRDSVLAAYNPTNGRR